MVTDLLFTILIIIFMILGIKNPVVAISAVLWIDTVKPQNTSFSFLAGKPLSLILTIFLFLSLLVSFKKLKSPKNKSFLILMLSFMVWITICTFYAQFPHVAWIKYDVSIKTLFLILFIPFVINSRREFDFALAILTASSSLFIIMAGVKAAMGGGGYGVSLIGLQGSGFMYSEGSMLSTLAVCTIPLLTYLVNYSSLKGDFIFKCFSYFVIFCALLTLIGTQARTGFVVLCLYILLVLYYSKSRLKFSLIVAVAAFVILPFVTDGFKNRLDSISAGTTTEKSAVGRIAVWRWTLEYVKASPIVGGGFYAYLANAGQLHLYSGKEGEVLISQKGAKAYHNILIEVLAETGYVGLCLFLLLIMQTLKINLRTAKMTKRCNVENKSSYAFGAKNLNVFLLLYCAGGMFINVAFYPWVYYIFALAVSNHKILQIEIEIEIENEKKI